MYVYLLLISVVIIACVIFNKISNRLGIPMLLVFIVFGMFFGTDGVIKVPFENYKFAEQICSIALIFIMFYGGFGTKWSKAKPIAVKAILLSFMGVLFTAGLTGVFCYYILGIGLLESFLTGAVISSTDAASVFAILRSKRLNLKNNTASLIEVESGSNDPAAYMITYVILQVMDGGISIPGIIYMIFAQIVFGIAAGVLIAYLSILFLKKFKFATDGFDAIFVLAIAILAYAFPSVIGGNGYLSTYIVGIILGNAKIHNKKSLVNFFDGITGLMQMLLFFLLGLLSHPSKLADVFFVALAVFLFLTFIARPISVFILLTPFKSSIRQQLLVAWSGLRGAASVVFAVMVTISSVTTNNDLFHIAFLIVLFSILIQGSLIPVAAGKLEMIDDANDVMKTFNDYTNEVPIQFIQFRIGTEHHWKHMSLSDIQLPPDTLVVLLERNGEKIVPNGETVIEAGDNLVLSAKSPSKIEGVSLMEKVITKDDEWKDKRICEIPKDSDMLIIMIQREGNVIIPNGETVIMENDELVLNMA